MVPAKWAKVGSTSMDQIISGLTRPAGMRPGQRIRQGVRTPPNEVALPSRKGKAEPA